MRGGDHGALLPFPLNPGFSRGHRLDWHDVRAKTHGNVDLVMSPGLANDHWSSANVCYRMALPSHESVHL